MTPQDQEVIREQFKSFAAENGIKHLGYGIADRKLGLLKEKTPCFVVSLEKQGFIKDLFGGDKKEVSAVKEFEKQISIPVVIDRIHATYFQ